MAKHAHLKSMEEQISNKGHASSPFHYSKNSSQTNEVMKSEDISVKAADKDGLIKLRAYQIHLEKGGSDLDNWLEAEHALSINN